MRLRHFIFPVILIGSALILALTQSNSLWITAADDPHAPRRTNSSATTHSESGEFHQSKSLRVRRAMSGSELLTKAREHKKRGDDEAARYCYELAISRGVEDTQDLHDEFARTFFPLQPGGSGTGLVAFIPINRESEANFDDLSAIASGPNKAQK